MIYPIQRCRVHGVTRILLSSVYSAMLLVRKRHQAALTRSQASWSSDKHTIHNAAHARWSIL